MSTTELEKRLARAREAEAAMPPMRTFRVILYNENATSTADQLREDVVEGHSLQYTDSGILSFQTLSVDPTHGMISRVTRVYAADTWHRVEEVIGLRMSSSVSVN